MSLRKNSFRVSLIVMLLVFMCMPAGTASADTNGTIEVQAMVPEGFVAPITVEVSTEDDYTAKLLITAENNYVLRKQLPSGEYTVEMMYTDTKYETDSSLWANTETFTITKNKSTILEIAVIDDTDGGADISFGEENNPFGTNEDPADFMAENAAKLEAEQKDKVSDIDENEEAGKAEDEKDKEEETLPGTGTIAEQGTSLIFSLLKYLVFCLIVFGAVFGGVYLYRRYKFGE